MIRILNYTCIYIPCELEDSKLLQPYDLNSNVKKHVEKKYSKYKSLEYLDLWADQNFKRKNTRLSFFFFDVKILGIVRHFIMLYEKKQLKSVTEASKAVERYFKLCRICKLDQMYSFQEHMFYKAASILLESEVESSVLFGKLFKLMSRNGNILDYVMNYLHPDHLNMFLKQLKLGGFCFRKYFPLYMLKLNAKIDHLLVLLQYINSFESDCEDVSDYVEDTYGIPLENVIPENYSIERFDLVLLTFAQSGIIESDASLILAMTLVWRSVSHAYLTSTEVQYILKKLTPDTEIQEFFQKTFKSYYQIFIFPTMRPRSLKHYARTAFRKFYQIPEAIDNSNLPSSLKSYLKLQQ